MREFVKQRFPFLISARHFNFRMVLTGPVSYLPNQRTIGLRGTVMSEVRLPADYYYSVWLRHLTKAYAGGGMRALPESLAEIGPGDALGLGLCALLCGANRYYAFDVVEFARNDENKKILKDLVRLFQNRTPIPDDKVYPLVEPFLDRYDFPHHILTKVLLGGTLKPERISAIEDAIDKLNSDHKSEVRIHYTVPWSELKIIEPATIDMIVSQAVLEHVSDLPRSYEAMRIWLKPGGLMSHVIDFRSHGLSNKWNGHWSYPKWLWQIMEGNRPYLLNRASQAEHLKLIQENGFRVLCTEPIQDLTGVNRNQLAREFRGLSDGDLHTRTVFVQAVKE